MTISTQQQYDGCGTPTPAVISRAVFETSASRACAPAICVRLQKLATGFWSVQAAAGGRGGLFRDHASATKFIRHEFAIRQRTVVETLSA